MKTTLLGWMSVLCIVTGITLIVLAQLGIVII
jgi:hypothetical protein